MNFLSTLNKFRSGKLKPEALALSDEQLSSITDFRTCKTVRSGMKRPAFKRHRMESTGMVSFNNARIMHPTKLQVDKGKDMIFQICPNLMDFKMDE